MTPSSRLRTPLWLLFLGILATTAGTPALRAQVGAPVSRPAAASAAPAGSGLETIEVRPNIYVIFGAGGNITAQIGEDGVVVVDSGSAARADQVVAAIRAITPKPVRLIINTSVDLEHTGGNEKLAAAGFAVNPDAFSDEGHATVLAHENVLNRMSADEKNYSSNAWPTETFTRKIRSMYINDAPLQIYRATNALNDGNVFVLFRNADLVVTGDILDLRHFPHIDAGNGGTIQGEIDALNQLLDIVVPAMPFVLKPGRTLIVPGHGRISDYAELVEYRDMLTIIRDNILTLVKKGMTLDQVKKANPLAGYSNRWGFKTGDYTNDKFIETIYNELKQPKG